MKQGFKVMDSDIHVREPHDLWARYIEPQFKERAPQFTNIPDGSSPGVWRFEGKLFPAYIDRPERQRLAKFRRQKSHDRHEELGREVGSEEERRGEDPEAMPHAMDVEGIDVSIVFRTRAAHVVAVDGLDPELTAAVRRAFNNWLADFCNTNRARLKPAALRPVHDVKLAAAEARRSVRESGAVAAGITQPAGQRAAVVRPLLRSPVGRSGKAARTRCLSRHPDGLPGAFGTALPRQLRYGARRGPSSGDDAGVGEMLTGGFRTFSGIDRRLSGGEL